MDYTKGPWEVAEDSTGRTWVKCKYKAISDDTMIANVGKGVDAALVAAAPDMYEACKALIMHKHQGNIHPIDYQRIEQALSKAEGR